MVVREGHVAYRAKAGFFGGLAKGGRVADAGEEKCLFHFYFAQGSFVNGFLPFLIGYHQGGAVGGFQNGNPRRQLLQFFFDFCFICMMHLVALGEENRRGPGERGEWLTKESSRQRVAIAEGIGTVD